MKAPRFPAVAFDLDGTLYPNSSFYARLIPFLLKESGYLRAFGKARDRLRMEYAALEINEAKTGEKLSPAGNNDSFYKIQARYMSVILKTGADSLEKKTEEIIYRGWEPLFKKVRLYSHVIDTLKTLRENGVKLALMSDFPPDKKIEYLGLSGLWDAVMCSETIGRLKPDPLPFIELQKTLNLPADEILYVGNSFSYDVLGARKIGMKTAWIRQKSMYFFPDKKRERQADFVFFDYRQLRNFVLI